MKYTEAEKQIKALSSKYDIDMHGGDFDVAYGGRTHIIYVSGDYEYGLYVCYPEMFSITPFSNKLYMILSELAATPLDKRVDKKKYQVKVFGQYLNVPIDGNLLPFLFYGDETEGPKTCFTLDEIEQLKQRKDIPLDWSKVELKSAE